MGIGGSEGTATTTTTTSNINMEGCTLVLTNLSLVYGGNNVTHTNHQTSAQVEGGGGEALLYASESAPLLLTNVTLQLASSHFSGYTSILGGSLLFPTNDHDEPTVQLQVVVECDTIVWNGGTLSSQQALGLPGGGTLPPTVVFAALRGEGGPHDCVAQHAMPATFTTSISISNYNVPTHMPPLMYPVALQAASSAVLGAVIASWVSTGSGGGGLSAVQGSLEAVRLAYRCSRSRLQPQNTDASADGDEESPSILGLTLSSFPRDVQAVGGTVIGNAALLVMVALVYHVMGVVKRNLLMHATPYASSSPSSPSSSSPLAAAAGAVEVPPTTNNPPWVAFVTALPTVLLPGSVIMGTNSLLLPSIRACVILLAASSSGLGPLVLGMGGLLAWVVPGGALWWVVCVRRHDGGAAGLAVELKASPTLRSGAMRAAPVRALHWIATRQFEWRRAGGHRGTTQAISDDVLDRYGVLLKAYNKRWYFVVDLCAATAGGAVLGAAWVAEDACAAAVWGTSLMIVLAASEVVLCVWLRPYVARIDEAVTVAVALLSIVADALVLGSLENEAAGVTSAGSAVGYVPIVLRVALGLVVGRTVAAAVHGVLPRDIGASTDRSHNPLVSTIKQQEKLRRLIMLAIQNRQAVLQQHRRQHELL